MNLPVIHPNKPLSFLACAALLVITAGAAKAQTVTPPLLTIDITDPSAVTITATLADPTQAASVDDGEGVELLEFFQNISGSLGFLPFYDATSSSLTAANLSSGPYLNQYSNDKLSGLSTVPDLALFNNAGGTSLTFSTSSTAFSGTMTLDLSSLSGNLPTAGTTGSIETGYSKDPGVVIGTYLVVSAPEPSTWALVAAGVALLSLLRLRSRTPLPIRK